jgi:hypothetical protein
MAAILAIESEKLVYSALAPGFTDGVSKASDKGLVSNVGKTVESRQIFTVVGSSY